MPNNNEQTVFIVDDEESILDALRLLMKSVNLNVKTFDRAQKFLDSYTKDQAGCLILDIRMPEISGLELQELLMLKKISLPIIFITGHGDIPMAVQAIKHGADEFIQKPFQDDELLRIIYRALKKDMQQRQTTGNSAEILERFQQLTSREKQVMQKMIEGNANKIIAIDLGISQRTVEIHRTNVMRKTQARSLAQLVKMSMLAELHI